jgi:hypothetical protein
MRSISECPTFMASGHYEQGFFGGIYSRPYGPHPKGFVHDGHEHHIDHATFIEAGAVKVKWRAPDGRSGEVIVEAPNFVPIKAEELHSLEALVDGTKWRCLFAEAEGDKLDAEKPVPYMMERRYR